MQETSDLSTLMNGPSFSLDDYEAVKTTAFSSPESLNRFAEQLGRIESSCQKAPSPNDAMKLGMCYLLVADADRAAKWIEQSAPGAQRSFFLALARRDQKRYDDAISAFEAAAVEGWNPVACAAYRAECMVRNGDAESARRVLDESVGEGRSTALWHYASGRVAQEQGEIAGASAAYDEALSIEPDHALAMFHAAYLADLHGDDERAMELYSRCAELPTIFGHALINLAILHEDAGHYEKAAACLRRVLAVTPSNGRARLYLKDVAAAEHMVIDEFQLKVNEQRDAVLDIPVSDFELSVRSRNCLKKMNINTLGDLLRTTEPELLAYKNFGETSLREIKAMLAQKGLTLGQYAPKSAEAAIDPMLMETANHEVLGRPVNSLELSVRARKCLQRLGIATVGELASKSENELLESRNFGTTSLREIKNQLTELGLSLRASS